MIISNFNKRDETWAKDLKKSWRKIIIIRKYRILDFKLRII